MGRTRRHNPKRRKTRRGGKVLAQGRDALVIDPAIPCKDDRDTSKYVTRLSKRNLKEDIVSRNHGKLIKRLKEIDPTQKYFYYPEYCEPGILLEENKRDGATYKNKKNSELVLRASKEWNPLANKERSWTGFLKGKVRGRKLPFEQKTEQQLDHLREAIKFLHEKGIYHGDLHGRNVVIADDGLPRIIDFGRAIIDAKDSDLDAERADVEDTWPSLDPRWRLSR
jgi:tRNA A-37 threonylcarbamoyl transferase component Bud32